MSQHPSLRSKHVGAKFRSVLKRFERLRHLIEKEKWGSDMSIFGLPKIKVLRFKIKKEKAAAEEVATETGATKAIPEGASAGAGAEAKKPGAEVKKPGAETKKPESAKEPRKEATPKKEAK